MSPRVYITYCLAIVTASGLFQYEWASHHGFEHFYLRWIAIGLVLFLLSGAIYYLLHRLAKLERNVLNRRFVGSCLLLCLVPFQGFIADGYTRASFLATLFAWGVLVWLDLDKLEQRIKSVRVIYLLGYVAALSALLLAIRPVVERVSVGLASVENFAELTLFPVLHGDIDPNRETYPHAVPTRAPTEISFDLPFDSRSIQGVAIRFGPRKGKAVVDRLQLDQRVLFWRLPLVRITGADLSKALHPAVPESEMVTGVSSVSVESNTQPAWIIAAMTGDVRDEYPGSTHPMWTALPIIICVAAGTLLLVPFLFRTRTRSLLSAAGTGVLLISSHYPRSSFSVMVGVAAILVTAGLLVSAEYTTRYIYRDVMTTSSNCGGDQNYFYMQSYPKIRAERNAFGFRGANFKVKPDDGVFRVVVMGDSFTYGQSVYPYTKRYPEIAQTLLDADPDRRVELINFGFAGRNLVHHLKYLDTVFAFHPDFVLYQWFVNDFEYNIPPEFRHFTHLAFNKSLHLWLCRHSALYTIADSGWTNVRRVFGSLKSYPELLVERYGDPASPDSIRADHDLDTLLDRLQQHHVKAGIVLFPHMISPMSSYPLGFLHERVLRKCAEHKIPCLDLREAYSRFDDDYRQFWANEFDAHPGEAAHRIAAEKIVEFFGRYWGPAPKSATPHTP